MTAYIYGAPKRDLVVTAIEATGTNNHDLVSFTGGAFTPLKGTNAVGELVNYGSMTVRKVLVTDLVVKDVHAEFRVVSPWEWDMLYDTVDEPPEWKG